MADPFLPRLPHGVRDYLPEAAARRRAVAEQLLGEFARWGYRRIVTPGFEYEAVLGRGLGPGARAVRFVEPATGEVVALRPDITPQVARLVATRLASEPGPIRLAYEGGVVRLVGPRNDARELFQAGVELIDAPSPAGDVEAIALAAAALAATGLERFTIDLGEASVARAALAGLPPETGEALRLAIAQKDVDGVARLGREAGLPAARRKLLEALPSLYGGAEVIERAKELLAGGRRSPSLAAAGDEGATRAALGELATVVERLGARGLGERISIDLGEVRGFDYYTGVRLQGYAPGVGDALLSGGRYDHLIESYGRPARAAGFAVDVERVADALLASGARANGASPAVYLVGEPRRRGALAAALRAAGVRVVEELDEPAPDPARLEGRALAAGADRILALGDRRGDRWWPIDAPGAATDRDAGAAIEAGAIDGFVDGRAPLDAVLPPRYVTRPATPASRRTPGSRKR